MTKTCYCIKCDDIKTHTVNKEKGFLQCTNCNTKMQLEDKQGMSELFYEKSVVKGYKEKGRYVNKTINIINCFVDIS